MTIQKKFAMTILMLRQQAKLKQHEVATDAEISLCYYKQLEAGKKNPTIQVVEKIAAVYSMRSWELLQTTENINN